MKGEGRKALDKKRRSRAISGASAKRGTGPSKGVSAATVQQNLRDEVSAIEGAIAREGAYIDRVSGRLARLESRDETLQEAWNKGVVLCSQLAERVVALEGASSSAVVAQLKKDREAWMDEAQRWHAAFDAERADRLGVNAASAPDSNPGDEDEDEGYNAVCDELRRLKASIAMNAGNGSPERRVRWEHVMRVTGLDADASQQLCRDAAVYPYEASGGEEPGVNDPLPTGPDDGNDVHTECHNPALCVCECTACKEAWYRRSRPRPPRRERTSHDEAERLWKARHEPAEAVPSTEAQADETIAGVESTVSSHAHQRPDETVDSFLKRVGAAKASPIPAESRARATSEPPLRREPMTPNEAFAVFDASMRAQGLTDVLAWHRKEERQAAHAVAEAAVTAERAARLEAEPNIPTFAGVVMCESCGLGATTTELGAIHAMLGIENPPHTIADQLRVIKGVLSMHADLEAIAAAVKQARSPNPPPSGPPVCKRCGDEYAMETGNEPTPYCDSCRVWAAPPAASSSVATSSSTPTRK